MSTSIESNNELHVHIPTGYQRHMYMCYKLFLTEHYDNLKQMYNEQLPANVRAKISLNDWILFAYNHTKV
jgi:hypothetical protein